MIGILFCFQTNGITIFFLIWESLSIQVVFLIDFNIKASLQEFSWKNKFYNLIRLSLKFITKGTFNNKLGLVMLQYIPRNMHTILFCFALLWLCNRS